MRKKIFTYYPLLLGINAILTQTILIRELLVNFSGNEISLGLILSVWFISAALGAYFVGRLILAKIKEPEKFSAAFLLVITLLIPLITFLSRITRTIFQIPIYEHINPLQILYISGMVLTPLSCLFGLGFVLSCKMLEKNLPQANGTGLAYILEAVGSALGGIIFTLIFVKQFNTFQIVMMLALLNLVYILFLTLRLKMMYAFFSILLLMGFYAVNNRTELLDKGSQALQWYPQKVLAYKNSPYGNISVTKTDNTISLYENNSILFTDHDTAFSEEFFHLIMLQHPCPKEVLLIGGGIGGGLQEVLKHNVDRITYLEIDNSVIEIGRRFLDPKNRDVLFDPRINIQNVDARFFLNENKRYFDVIIIDLPDPTTLQLNRFYTKQFYEKVFSHLTQKGILATRISSNETIISNEMARYNSSIYKTLKSIFPFVTYIPGDRLILIASADKEILKNEPDLLTKRFKERKIKTTFLTAYHIRDKYYPAVINYLTKRLNDAFSLARINEDFYPISLYYNLTLWGIMFSPSSVRLFNFIADIKPFGFFLFIFLMFVALYMTLVKKRRDSATNAIALLAIAISGALGIGLEIIILLSFQVKYGYVYEKVGLLISMFMVGLATGGYIMNKNISRIKKGLTLLANIIFGYTLYMALLMPIICVTDFLTAEKSQLIFYLMNLIAGAGVGLQFPAAVSILQKQKSAPFAASLIWGADILGAAIGAFLSSLITIPLLGIPQTLLLYFEAGAFIFLLLFLSRKRPLR